MMDRRWVVGVFVLLCVCSSAMCELSDEEVLEAMLKAAGFMRSISTNGGYCGIYSLDLKQRYGEATYERANANEVWVQPPGTPTVGQAFLRAYRVTGDEYYLDAARDAARALVWGQRTVGGWDHRVDVSHLTADAETPVRKKGRCTFDDNITQAAIEFLIDIDGVLDEAWLTNGVELGLKFMRDSQFENGAWPQWYPLRGGYHDHYTFNDNSMNDCIKLMIKAHKVYGKDEYLRCARRGADFIILSQGKDGQAGWAQQYSHDMKPAKARSFEPAGICSAVTGRNIRTLVDVHLYTKDEKYLAPVEKAVEWLIKSQVRTNLWARLYEVGSNKPIYGDRTNPNKVIYDYDKVSTREKTSYAWQGEYGIGGIIARYNKVRKVGAEKYLAEMAKSKKKRRKNTATAQTSINAMDDKGRWVDANKMITTKVFVVNFYRLCDYIEGE